mmetsp:Transcript_35793/g.82138  ORF Transcript_35793/g.82138 Transcript_35793/m.82138 type:complete len:1348 (+) Transcript_35793:167-4210(+)
MHVALRLNGAAIMRISLPTLMAWGACLLMVVGAEASYACGQSLHIEQCAFPIDGEGTAIDLLQRKALEVAKSEQLGEVAVTTSVEGPMEQEPENLDVGAVADEYLQDEASLLLLQESQLSYSGWEAPYAAVAELVVAKVCGALFLLLLTYLIVSSPRHGPEAILGNAAGKGVKDNIDTSGRCLVALLIVAGIGATAWGRRISLLTTGLTPRLGIGFCSLWSCPVMVHWLTERIRRRAWKVECAIGRGPPEECGPAVPTTLALPGAKAPESPVLLASLEHDLPHKGVRMVSGGLGKVIGMIASKHPLPVTMVHPILSESGYDLENDKELSPVEVVVDGEAQVVRVFESSHVSDVSQGDCCTTTFWMLQHPWFHKRKWTGIYPSTVTGQDELQFFSLWNQAVGALLVRLEVPVFHCPDYHTAMAPLYALQDHPALRTLLVLHNADYQGCIRTDMVDGARLARLSEVFNLEPGIIQQHCLHDGRFNMLKAGVEVIKRQQGKGLCAVSTSYARELQHEHTFLRGMTIAGVDNPMEDSPSLRQEVQKEGSLEAAKLKGKVEVQKLYGLKVDPHAKLLVFLGRMVKQKGMDLFVELLPWLMDYSTGVQCVFLGPVGDAYGVYARWKLEGMVASAKYQGQLYVCFQYVEVPPALYFAADFCVTPSRDEPFGYADIEFACRGALCIGAAVGGLGKVPGFYYTVDDKENDSQLREGLREAMRLALQQSTYDLEALRKHASEIGFPVHRWQAKLGHQTVAQMLAHYVLKPEALTAPPVKNKWGDRSQKALASKDIFTPELDSDELGEKVHEALELHPNASLKQILAEIAVSHDMSHERTVSSRSLLRPVKLFGLHRVRWIHIVIGLVYISAPVVDMAVVFFVQQWIALTMPEQTTEAKLMMAEIRAAAFVVHSLGVAIGSGVWLHLCSRVPPRSLLILALCLEPPLLLFMYASAASELSLLTDGRVFLLSAMFLHGASSASAVLFVVFNFMMTTIELQEITVITNAFDSARALVTVLMSTYVFSVPAESFQSSTLVVAPLVLSIAARTLLAWPLLHAPRAYREERMPDLGISAMGIGRAIWQYKAYASLVAMECMGQVAAFPSLLCVVWFSMGGWSIATYTAALQQAALVLVPAMLVWGWIEWSTASRDCSFIVGTALYIPPVTPVFALIMQQASLSHAGALNGYYATLLFAVLFVVKSARSSALGVLRTQLVRPQWHFVALRSIEACFANFSRAISPLVCSTVLQYMSHIEAGLAQEQEASETSLHAWSFEADNLLELANAITVTTLPLAAVEIVLQLMAMHSVREELSLPAPPAGHPRSSPEGVLRNVAAIVTTALFWACFGSAHAKIVGPLSFT